MTLPVVNLSSPLVGPGGLVKDPWTAFFRQFTQAPSGAMSLILGASPFGYRAKEPGQISVAGGVSGLTLIRGTVSIDVTGLKLVPVQINDTLIISYGGATTATFLPNF